MKCSIRLRIILPVLLLVCCNSMADVITVPDMQPTIKDGVSAAQAGDTVLINPGVYYEHSIELNQSVVLAGNSVDPSHTIIDGGRHGKIIVCSGYGNKSRIERLTIRGGLADSDHYISGNGGGISCIESSPTISECAIVGNTAYYGGGIGLWGGASPTIVQSQIADNIALSKGGGLFAYYECIVTIDSCGISGNTARYGGGIYLLAGSATSMKLTTLNHNAADEGGAINFEWGGARFSYMEDCNFLENRALSSLYGGGAFYLYNAKTQLRDCLLDANSSKGSGGAICLVTGGKAFLYACAITGNTADGNGGAISSWTDYDSSLIVEDCVMAKNTAIGSGGAIFGHWGPNYLTHSTFMGNGANRGGHFYFEFDAEHTTIDKCLLTNSFSGGALSALTNTGVPKVTCTNIWGNVGGDWTGTLEFLRDSSGNMSSDPLYCDTSADDYHLYDSSPCTEQNSGCGDHIGAFIVGCGITDVADPESHYSTPKSWQLFQNCPNPFNPSTTIEYTLPSPSLVKLFVYNILGEEVVTLVNEPQSAGHKKIVWNGRNALGGAVSSGIYFYRIEADKFVQSRKMLLLK